jgi:hypothetical protein
MVSFPLRFPEVDQADLRFGCSWLDTTIFEDMFAEHEELSNWTEVQQGFELTT